MTAVRPYILRNPPRHHPPLEHIQQIIAHYQTDHRYVRQLLVHKDCQTWQALRNKMISWGLGFLGRNRIYLDKQTCYELAISAAHLASAQLAHKPFYYHAPFDAWACEFLKRTLQGELQKYETQQAQFERQFQVSDEWVWEQIPDPSHEETQRKIELHELIQELSPSDQHIVQAHYFDGIGLADIAQQLNITSNTIYQRHARALNRLKRLVKRTLTAPPEPATPTFTTHPPLPQTQHNRLMFDCAAD